MEVAFKMKLNKGMASEYKRRHDEIWPELKMELINAGIYDYSIYVDEETDILFAVHKMKGDNTAGALSELDIVKKWWDYMADIMAVNADNSPVIVPLKNVFHLE
jgi:L-rhamnose mutarotase